MKRQEGVKKAYAVEVGVVDAAFEQASVTLAAFTAADGASGVERRSVGQGWEAGSKDRQLHDVWLERNSAL